METEGAFDPVYAWKLGVDVDKLIIRQPDTIEDVFTAMETIIEIWEEQCRVREIPVLIVWDSVAGSPPKAELEGAFDDDHMAVAARRISQALRKIMGKVSNRQAALIFTNQVRENIGVMFGNKIRTYGGRAIKFHASHRIALRRTERRKAQSGDIIAIGVEAKIEKNKTAPPFRVAEFEIVFGRGVCRAAEAITLGERYGLIQVKGSWVNMGDERLGQGREKAVQALLAAPDMLDGLIERIKTKTQED